MKTELYTDKRLIGSNQCRCDQLWHPVRCLQPIRMRMRITTSPCLPSALARPAPRAPPRALVPSARHLRAPAHRHTRDPAASKLETRAACHWRASRAAHLRTPVGWRAPPARGVPLATRAAAHARTASRHSPPTQHLFAPRSRLPRACALPQQAPPLGPLEDAPGPAPAASQREPDPADRRCGAAAPVQSG